MFIAPSIGQQVLPKHDNQEESDMTRQHLTSPTDIHEFKSGIESYTKDAWSSDRWKTFRLRFGVYDQRQPGKHMVRAKLPGGRLNLDQARAIGKAKTECGIHLAPNVARASL